MSRRKGDVQYEDFAIDIVCPSGHRLGTVAKHGPQHARAGTYTTYGGVDFEESPSPSPDSGRIRGTCPQCGAQMLLRWDKVRAQLDRNSEIGCYRDQLGG